METELCPPGVPCRFGYWNIPVSMRVIFFTLIFISVIVMVWGIYRRVKLWRQGQSQLAFDQPLRRLVRVLKYAVAQVKILWQRYPGVMHFAIFWSMALLFLGTVLATIDHDIFHLIFNSKLLRGNLYLIYKTVLDLAALFMLVGLGLAIYRRYVVRAARLNIDWRFNFTLPLLAYIILTGLLIEATRLAVQRPEWGPFSVVGYPISLLLRGMDDEALMLLHKVLWNIHWIGVAAGFATLPWTNLYHIFSAAANTFFTPFKGRGILNPIPDLENAERLGASALPDFGSYQLANFDACTECGRCQVVCPAYMANQPLNPKYVILNLRDYMSERAPRPLGLVQAAARTPTYVMLHEDPDAKGRNGANTPGAKNGSNGRTMVGDIVSHEALWACTTCVHCVYECPVLIEHVDAIVDMRRYLALTEGDIPGSLATTLTNIERAGNPWKQPRRKRAAWTQNVDFEVPIMANVGEADVLWWVGCAGSYDPRNQKVTRALATILHEAGVNFAILGEEETCNGDQARRAGNEYLFQQLATQNIETMKQYKFKTIIAQCPHCFNVLQNEYPQLGGNYQVMHHSQFIQKLLNDGDIRVRRTAGGEETLTYHDPCYLGRYNEIYDAPREVATSGGKSLVEMTRSRDMAMCCGGGGARVWMEDEGEVRINRNRMAQIMATGQNDVAVACPFCMIMLEDARGVLDAENVQIRDIAEIVAENLITAHKDEPTNAPA